MSGGGARGRWHEGDDCGAGMTRRFEGKSDSLQKVRKCVAVLTRCGRQTDRQTGREGDRELIRAF